MAGQTQYPSAGRQMQVGRQNRQAPQGVMAKQSGLLGKVQGVKDPALKQ